MILSTISLIASVSVFALIVAAALSPIESLSWWAGWNDKEAEAEDTPPPAASSNPTDKHFIVYLSGVSTMAGRYLTDREVRFLEQLKVRVPTIEVISDIFPYSPSGAPLLAAPRLFDRFWRMLLARRLKGRSAMSFVANLRNIFQVLVSADNRYGPIFNFGASQVIAEALERHGYRQGSGAPVTIIGYSGGAQIGLGATPFLTFRLDAPVDVIALGGVLASGPGVGAVRKLHRLYGARDGVHRLGYLFFPERWGVYAHSKWNKAKRDGRIIPRKIGRMAHAGPSGYFGVQEAADGRRYVDHTLDAVAGLLT